MSANVVAILQWLQKAGHGILQFMQIPQACKALFGGHDGEVDIEISIRLLCYADHVHQLLHGIIDSFVVFPEQEVTGALDPLRNVGIPEQMVWDWPHVWLIVVGRIPFQLKGIVTACRLEDVKLVE